MPVFPLFLASSAHGKEEKRNESARAVLKPDQYSVLRIYIPTLPYHHHLYILPLHRMCVPRITNAKKKGKNHRKFVLRKCPKASKDRQS